MSDRGFTKLFHSILTSTIWDEDSDTRVLWVSMLAMADEYGQVIASIPSLARCANIPLAACEVALGKFQSPDKNSRTKDFEGRRIEEIDGGWRLLNFDAYRNKMSEVERREYKRVKEAERRQRLKTHGHAVDKRGKKWTEWTQEEEEEDSNEDSNSNEDAVSPSLNSSLKNKKKRKPESLAELLLFCAKSGISESDGKYFYDLKEENNWTNSGKPVGDWQRTILRWKNECWLPSLKNGNGKPATQKPTSEMTEEEKKKADWRVVMDATG